MVVRSRLVRRASEVAQTGRNAQGVGLIGLR